MSLKKSIEQEQGGRIRLFQKSVRRRQVLRQADALLGSTQGLHCLSVGGDPLVHYYLAQRGGEWLSAGLSESAVVELGGFMGKKVRKAREGQLPFEDGQFDRIVIVGGLEQVEDDHAFIRDSHRALNESGQLIITVRHAKRWALARLLRNMVGLDKDSEAVRAGYTPKELFDVLKDGFDVGDIKSFSRFFLEFTDMIFQLIGGSVIGAGANQAMPGVLDDELYERAGRYFAAVYPFLWLADKLDALLFLTRGYFLAARAKRRIWQPRRIPVLSDGRSIAEATLKTKIGTAAPY